MCMPCGDWRLYLQGSGYGTDFCPSGPISSKASAHAGDDARLHGCLGNQAVILQATGDLDGAMRLHKEKRRSADDSTTPPGCKPAWATRRDPAGHRGPRRGHAAAQGRRGDLPTTQRPRRVVMPAWATRRVILQATGTSTGPCGCSRKKRRSADDSTTPPACLAAWATRR